MSRVRPSANTLQPIAYCIVTGPGVCVVVDGSIDPWLAPAHVLPGIGTREREKSRFKNFGTLSRGVLGPDTRLDSIGLVPSRRVESGHENGWTAALTH